MSSASMPNRSMGQRVSIASTRSACPPLRKAAVGPTRQASLRVQASALPTWGKMFDRLNGDLPLAFATPEDAAVLVNQGQHTLIDVRLPGDYDDAHIAGAVSVPLYVDIGPADNPLKWALLSSQGVRPVGTNPTFADDLRKAAAGSKSVIFYCEAGGTLSPTQSFKQGKPSRSLQACYCALAEEVLPAGSQVLHLERGIFGWFQAGLPINGDYYPQTGRSPNAAVDPTLARINQERGYELREGDAPAPEAAEGKKKFMGIF